MPKYLYTTVYETFTGAKPPETHDESEGRRKRSFGHPYKMRFNNAQSAQRQRYQSTTTEGTTQQRGKRCRSPYRIRSQSNRDNHKEFANRTHPQSAPSNFLTSQTTKPDFGYSEISTNVDQPHMTTEPSEHKSASFEYPSCDLEKPHYHERVCTQPRVTYKKKRYKPNSPFE